MKILTVIPLQKGAFREDLTYFTAKDAPVGAIVEIPVRKKNILGLVASTEDAEGAKSDIKNMDFNLRKVTEVKGNSVFRPEFLESALELAKYSAARKNDTIASLIPAAFRENYDLISKAQNVNPGVLHRPSGRAGANFQQEIMRPQDSHSARSVPEKLLFQSPLAERVSHYKTLIRSSFAEKKSVFIVLPTERDIEIFSELLQKGIENFTFSVHGGMTTKKQTSTWLATIACPHPVLILATAPYVSIPRADIGTVIIEHESSGAYKLIARPYLDLRIFAEFFAAKMGARLIFADTLLRFDTIARRENEHFGEVRFSFRTDSDCEIKILEKEEKPARPGGFNILPEAAREEIQSTLQKGENVFIFSLRKGLGTLTVCRDCGTPVFCDKCSAPVVLYFSRDKSKRRYACNRCHSEKDSNTKCATCGGWNLMPLGVGTDAVAEACRENFPKTEIFQLDKESVKTAPQAKKIAAQFAESRGAILVGTELAFPYLPERVPLSVIASLDSLFSIPNFRIGERALQLLLAIIAKSNRLLIRTKNPNEPALRAITEGNILPYVREELADREKLGYPPYVRFLKITHQGTREQAAEIKHALAEVFREYEPHIYAAFTGRQAGAYITNMLIKIPAGKMPDERLAVKILSLPPEFSVHADPEDIL